MELLPWHAHYDAGVPPSLAPYPARTLLDYVADAVRERPEHPAVLFRNARLTYRELQQQSDYLALSLAELGVRRGDRLALLLPNSPQFLLAELAAWKLGAIVCPLNPLYSDRELLSALAVTGAESIVVPLASYTQVKRIQSRVELRHVVVTTLAEHLPHGLRMLSWLRPRPPGQTRLRTGDVWLADAMRPHLRAFHTLRPQAPEQPALLLMSGGTTGTPKAAIGTHGALVASGLQLRAWLQSALGEWDDAVLLPLPLFHVYAGVGVLSAALIGHNPLALTPNPRDITELLHTLRAVQPTLLLGVPSLFASLITHPEVRAGKVDLTPLELCLCATAPLPAEVRARLEEMTGGRALDSYSLTEAMMACTATPVRGVGKHASAGLPLPDVELRVVDAERGERALPPGETGEILLHAPQLMQGYWNAPDESERVLRRDAEGRAWLATGDLGYLDHDGFLTLAGRKKELIKANGFQVWPQEVEQVIAQHRAVAEVRVAGVPDGVRGELVRAWVVLRPGEQLSEGELRTFCRQELAAYKVPASVEFCRALPAAAAPPGRAAAAPAPGELLQDVEARRP